MQHRHLEGEPYSLTSIDDIITNGRLADWVELANASAGNPDRIAKIRHIASAMLHCSDDPSRQIFWLRYCDDLAITAVPAETGILL